MTEGGRGITSGAHPHRPAYTVLAAVAGFSTITIFTQLATRNGATLATVLAMRYVFACGVLVTLLPSRALLGVEGRQMLLLTAVCGSLQASIGWLSLGALAYIPAATVVFLFYSFPVWVALYAIVTKSERLDGRKLVALLLAMTGIATVVGWSSGVSLNVVGATMALSAAVLYAVAIPILRRLQAGVAPTVATTFVGAGAGLIFLTIGALRGELQFGLSWQTWGWIVALGIISTALAFSLFLTGLAALGPVRTAIISTAEPFFVAIQAALVLGQPITLGTIVGGSCIAAAVVLLEMNPRPRPS
jgi:drug/metabolite transporter (DMT)-like permease